MQPQPIQYHTFMLRIWTEPQIGNINGIMQQRFVLSNTGTGEQWGFVSIDELQQFLEQRFPENVEVRFNVESTPCL